MKTQNVQSGAPQESSFNRRALVRGAAWAAPTAIMATAVPSYASSLVKNPGVNGWVLTSANGRGCSCDVTVTSRPSNPGPTPDGAPYGLYLYDTDERSVYREAKLVYWVRGDDSASNRISWRSGHNHSSCWSGPTLGTPQVKSDGALDTPNTWSCTCPIDPADVAGDDRLHLGHFEVSASINQSFRGRCEPLQFWAYREITVDRDGDVSKYDPEVLSFERHADLTRNSGCRSTEGMDRSAKVEEAPAASDGGEQPEAPIEQTEAPEQDIEINASAAH